MANRSIVFTVTNDLSYDQRMNRICSSLVDAGYKVTLIGRKKIKSSPTVYKKFNQHRINCFFEKGKLFYLEYNFKLFLYLLTHPFDIICGIDLDTILPTYYASKIKHVPFVYDAHEYFTEMEEVVARPRIKKVWEFVERLIVPKLKYAYTVSDGYANFFFEKYGVRFGVIKNATVLQDLPVHQDPEKVKYILYQGAVNVGRGLENLLHAMTKVDCQLYICGKGDIYTDLKALTKKLDIDEKITFCGYVDPEQLREYTLRATIGITFFSNKGLSNYYSLANRFSDYMHSCVPQIAMDFPEYRSFNKNNEVALLIDSLEVDKIEAYLNRLLKDTTYYEKLQENCKKAREEYNWQNEEVKLVSFYNSIP